ncbi:MAG: DUF4864 domain-containing protein [Pseudomonadota bacterium]
MKLIAAVVAFAAALAMFAGTEAARSNPQDGIAAVIERQVQAFQRDDGKAAFAIASPTIQQKFGSAARFMMMVATAYPQIYRADELTFLDRAPFQGRILQKVLVKDVRGELVTAVYAMVQIDKMWRIDGCWLLKTGSEV